MDVVLLWRFLRCVRHLNVETIILEFYKNMLLGHIYFENYLALEIIPQTELAMRGSNGFAKGPWKVRGAAVVHFDQEKCILGDTCSRLAYAKQQVASSNINIYIRKSAFFGPDGSWGQLATRRAS